MSPRARRVITLVVLGSLVLTVVLAAIIGR